MKSIKESANMAKGKWKTFALGAVFGSLLAGGLGYANAAETNVQALSQKVTYSIDGQPEHYVSLHSLAAAKDKEVVWGEGGQSADMKQVDQIEYEAVKLNEAPDEIQ